MYFQEKVLFTIQGLDIFSSLLAVKLGACRFTEPIYLFIC